MERATPPVGGDRTLIDRVQDGFSRGTGGETVNKNPKIQDPRSKEEWQRKSAKDRKRERERERRVGILCRKVEKSRGNNILLQHEATRSGLMQVSCLGVPSRQYLAGSLLLRRVYNELVGITCSAARRCQGIRYSGYSRVSYSIQLAPEGFSLSSQQRRESVVHYHIGCKFRVRGHDALALHAGMRWTVERAAVIRPPPSFGLCGVSVLLAGLSALEPIAGRAGMSRGRF